MKMSLRSDILKVVSAKLRNALILMAINNHQTALAKIKIRSYFNYLGVGMAWLFLILAGFFEIGWPLGFKLSQNPNFRISGVSIAIASMAVSGYFLWMAQKTIPMGTAYAVWTGIGGAGTFLVGVLFFADPSSFLRYLGVSLIIAGVITLKVAN